MSSNQVDILGWTMCTLLFGWLALRNSRTERDNLARFPQDGELRATRALPVSTIVFGLFACAAAVVIDHGKGDRTWPIAFIGALGTLAAFVATLSYLRLDREGVRFGLLGRKRVAFSEIVDFVRIYAYRGSPCYVVLRSGKRIEFGEGLACERILAQQIQQRLGCKLTWHDKGMPYPAGF